MLQHEARDPYGGPPIWFENYLRFLLVFPVEMRQSKGCTSSCQGSLKKMATSDKRTSHATGKPGAKWQNGGDYVPEAPTLILQGAGGRGSGQGNRHEHAANNEQATCLQRIRTGSGSCEGFCCTVHKLTELVEPAFNTFDLRRAISAPSPCSPTTEPACLGTPATTTR